MSRSSSEIRDLTDGELMRLAPLSPEPVTAGTVGHRCWWLARYPRHPLLLRLASDAGSRHVWFPGATPRRIREWVENQNVPA